jgi:hypothetical protein
MPDPHVLYAVTAVVVAGLAGWVVLVLSRAPRAVPFTGATSPAPSPKVPEPKKQENPAPRARLDSHDEIQDDAPSDAGGGGDVEEEEQRTGPNKG